MDRELITELYRKMLLIRRFEEEAARLYTERKIGGFLHLYIGQEAVAVGAISVLESRDFVVSSYRCHGHYLARGGSPAAGMAELLGKESGCSRGRGGSMHFFDASINFMGGWGIVGAHLPLSAGIAFASKYNDTGSVVMCFFGDGAINQGAFHEGLSLSSLWKLPVVFIIENNQFAMGTPITKTAATEDLSIRALGYPMARAVVDGHDVFAVRTAVHEAVARARDGGLPTLIEANTYRYRGHSMADPAKYRSKEELKEWKERDPVKTLRHKLTTLEGESVQKEIEEEVEGEILKAIQFAENSPFPLPESALDYTYVETGYNW